MCVLVFSSVSDFSTGHPTPIYKCSVFSKSNLDLVGASGRSYFDIRFSIFFNNWRQMGINAGKMVNRTITFIGFYYSALLDVDNFQNILTIFDILI